MPALNRKRILLLPRFRDLALLALLALLAVSLPARASSEDDNGSSGEDYVQVRMGGSLWETLIDNGIDPTRWKEVYQYNKENNPVFARIRTAKSIPRGTTVFIPVDWDVKPSHKATPAPARPAIRDTVSFLDGMAFVEITSSSRRRVTDIVESFCVPTSVRDSREKALLIRGVVSDLKDLYRRMDRKFVYRDRTFYIPLYLLAENQRLQRQRVNQSLSDSTAFVPRDSILPVSPDDIVHPAKRGESYADLAKQYAGTAKTFPARYPYRNSPREHLAYMAQIIRHYNLNQPLWPGRKYFIPAWLPDGKYYDSRPEVSLMQATRARQVYSNGLEVSLEYHVTRHQTYWRRREKYYSPFKRQLPDGAAAFPDMLLWHRTGLEPEVEEILRSRGQQHFSLRYIYRTGVANYYIDENGECFLIVDPELNARDQAGSPLDFRCFWNGEANISDVSIGIEVEGWFQGDLSSNQLDTARKLEQMLQSRYIIADDRVLDHRKVACRRGPDMRLVRGRKADGLSQSDRLALGIQPVLDPDVLRHIVDPNLDGIQKRQADSLDYWFKVALDPDLEATARLIGWQRDGDQWQRPAGSQPEDSFPSTN